MAVSKYGLVQTKGSFQVRGIVSGSQSNNFYREITTSTGQPMRIINFDVEYEKGKRLRLNLTGSPRDYVYFSKSSQNGGKPETEKVSWGDRFSFNREGFDLIGVRLGLAKVATSDGKQVNERKIVTEYDACKEVQAKLHDGQSVYVFGNIEHRSYFDKSGNKKQSVNLVPTQISLCQDVDFSDEQYKPLHAFKQAIVFMGIAQEKNDDGKATGRFTIPAKILEYSSIEDAEFIVESVKLANTFKKALKPYNAITVEGKIIRSIETAVVEEDDGWGEPSEFNKVTAPSKIEYIVSRGNKDTIDAELYTQSSIENAIAKIAQANKISADFGDDDDEWDIGDNDIDDIPWKE